MLRLRHEVAKSMWSFARRNDSISASGLADLVFSPWKKNLLHDSGEGRRYLNFINEDAGINESCSMHGSDSSAGDTC